MVKVDIKTEYTYSLLESNKTKMGVSKKVTKHGIEVYNIILAIKKRFPQRRFPNIASLRYYVYHVYGLEISRTRMGCILYDLVNKRYLDYDKRVYINHFNKVCGVYSINRKKRNIARKLGQIQDIDITPYTKILTFKEYVQRKKDKYKRCNYPIRINDTMRKEFTEKYREERRQLTEQWKRQYESEHPEVCESSK